MSHTCLWRSYATTVVIVAAPLPRLLLCCCHDAGLEGLDVEEAAAAMDGPHVGVCGCVGLMERDGLYDLEVHWPDGGSRDDGYPRPRGSSSTASGRSTSPSLLCSDELT